MTTAFQIGNELPTELPIDICRLADGYAILIQEKQISSQMFFPRAIEP